MEKIIDQINSPDDVKKLTIKQKEKLAQEIRKLLIDTVSKTGGHLASNLGIVELTIALHSVFNLPNDKIVWDVGHQTYVHKILTGRKNELNSLRKLNGLAGFPKVCESKSDCFNTGHSSTSISVALGMARARDIKNTYLKEGEPKDESNVIAVIGDGALTGGMALEALNDAANSSNHLIVILNDNEMSISKNIGGINRALGRLRTKQAYKKTNHIVKRICLKVPVVGKKMISMTRKIKYSIKQLIFPNMIFEDLGFKYFGPIYGHDIEKIESLLKITKNQEGPILIHIVTKKGKGYKPAEDKPSKFHSTGPFDIATGESLKQKKDDYSKIFGNKLVELAKKDTRIVAITAAMKDGTGLSNFAATFPERFYDVAIAEQHALGMAAGLASQGMRPVVPIYSSFYQRGYDQVIHDICIQELPVIMCVDRAGIVGNDGETHQGIFDMSFFKIVPNITIMAPKDFKELEEMLEYAVSLNKPVVIRYPRGGESNVKFDIHEKLEYGKAEKITEGKDLTIVAIGKMVARAKEVADKLKENNIEAEVINARFLKPLDDKTIVESILKTGKVITIEDNTLIGGLGSTIEECIVEKIYNTELNKKISSGIKIEKYGYPDVFVQHGSVDELEKKYGLDTENIVNNIKKMF